MNYWFLGVLIGLAIINFVVYKRVHKDSDLKRNWAKLKKERFK